MNSMCNLLFSFPYLRIRTQSVQFIDGLVPAADTVLFSHTPAAAADETRLAFPL